jgi:hypothetical protein
MLTATTTSTAFLLRLSYDPAVLDTPTATPGDILGPDHPLEFCSPQPGRINVIVTGIPGTSPFVAPSGVVCSLAFTVKPATAADGSTITLTTAGLPALPASCLQNDSGTSVTHTVTPGRVTVDRVPHDTTLTIK